MQTTIALNHAQTVASLYAAFGKGDIAFIMDHIAGDCKWTGIGGDLLPQGGHYTGKEVANFFKALGDALIFNAFAPETILSAGENEVVAYGTMTCTAKATGKVAPSDWAMRWVFDSEGKVVAFHDYHDTVAEYLALQP